MDFTLHLFVFIFDLLPASDDLVVIMLDVFEDHLLALYVFDRLVFVLLLLLLEHVILN